MYISCDVPNGNTGEPETGYVPNNPLFGLPVDSSQDCSTSCGGCASSPEASSVDIAASLIGSDFDCGSCLDQNIILSSSQGGSPSNLNNNFWNNEDMTSTFPNFPSLEIETLPSLFPYSPCSSSYNFPPSQATLSYTVHPQMLVPSGHQPPQATNSHYEPQTYYDSTYNQHSPSSIYPSMSVNVSMNMTMHGYGTDGSTVPLQCLQMQWTPQNTSSPVNVLYPSLLSPTHYSNGSSYNLPTENKSCATNNRNSTLPPISPIADTIKHSALSPSQQHNCYQQNPSHTPPKTSSQSTISQMKNAKCLGIGFEDDDNSIDGVDIEESRPNLCRLCGKTYARPSTLKTHLRTHSGERPYRCPDCNKSFSQAANLTAHVRTHTGQKPFRCPICDRRFSQSSSVTTHMRTHSGERPYRCRTCKKSFSDSSTLTKHLRIHSGEKPYQCKLCLLRFSQSGNLNRHMRVHGTHGNLVS